MTSPAEGQMHGYDPSARAGEMFDKGREVYLSAGKEIAYSIQPGNPESRLPLQEQTETLASIGLDDTEVTAEIRLGESFKAWLVRSKEDSYALINGDAAENLAMSKLIAHEKFMKTFMKSSKMSVLFRIFATRALRSCVFPVPGPAMTSIGPSISSTASFWFLFSCL